MKKILIFLLLASPAMASFDTFTSTKFGVWQGGCSGYFVSASSWSADIALSTTNNLNTLRTNWDVWTQLETSEDVYDFTTADAKIAVATSSLETVMFNIPIHNNTWGIPRTSNTHDREAILVRLSRFCTTVVHRYKSVISYWEVWNEADNSSFWPPTNPTNPKEYLDLLRVAYKAIKTEDPTAQVILGGIAFPYNYNANSWLNGFLDLGGGNYFDIMNIHIYSDVGTTGFVGLIVPTNTFNTCMTTTKNDLISHGLNKQIWITELNSTGSTYAAGHTTAEDQAIYLAESFTQALSTTSVGRVIWHTIRDCNGQNFGMFNADYSTKPASVAWKTYQTQLLNYIPQGTTAQAVSGFHAYDFTNAGTEKWIGWSETTTTGLVMPAAYTQVGITDLYGVATTTYNAAGFAGVVITTYPVFMQFIP